MADRYCRNCGQELAETDAFCPNCGRPVHETAEVPTPEANRDVPPPPTQSVGDGAPQEGWPQRHPILTGCLGIIVLLVLLGIIGSALGGGGDETAGGGGGQQARDSGQEQPEQQGQQGQQAEEPQPPPEYTVGQTAKVGNVEWTVRDAFLTNQLKSDFGTQKRGRFVVVDFTFTNNRSEEVTLDPQLHMVLKDSQRQPPPPLSVPFSNRPALATLRPPVR